MSPPPTMGKKICATYESPSRYVHCPKSSLHVKWQPQASSLALLLMLLFLTRGHQPVIEEVAEVPILAESSCTEIFKVMHMQIPTEMSIVHRRPNSRAYVPPLQHVPITGSHLRKTQCHTVQRGLYRTLINKFPFHASISLLINLVIFSFCNVSPLNKSLFPSFFPP